jgi:hypothetical protein
VSDRGGCIGPSFANVGNAAKRQGVGDFIDPLGGVHLHIVGREVEQVQLVSAVLGFTEREEMILLPQIPRAKFGVVPAVHKVPPRRNTRPQFKPIRGWAAV